MAKAPDWRRKEKITVAKVVFDWQRRQTGEKITIAKVVFNWQRRQTGENKIIITDANVVFVPDRGKLETDRATYLFDKSFLLRSKEIVRSHPRLK